MAAHRGLEAFARSRHGALALGDGPRFGLSPGALSRWADRDGWRRPHPGVVVLPGAPATFELDAVAATLAVGGRVLAAGWTAAYLTGMTRSRPDVVDLVVPESRRAPVLPGVRVRRSRTLVHADATVVDGIPVTTPARTVVDLAATTPVAALRNLVIDARQRRLVTLDQVTAVHARLPHTPGGRTLARVLADLDEQVCDSRLEWDFRKLIRAAGLSPHPRPFPFRCSDGVTIEIDVAFPAAWVACECDGLSSRAERAGLTIHHRRQNAAVADGWQPFLVDWTRLAGDPDGLLADLRELLRRADPARPPALIGDPRLVDPRFRGRRC